MASGSTSTLAWSSAPLEIKEFLVSPISKLLQRGKNWRSISCCFLSYELEMAVEPTKKKQEASQLYQTRDQISRQFADVTRLPGISKVFPFDRH